MLYRIYRLRDSPREHFRLAAHTGGTAVVKPKDYETTGEIDASTPYLAWKLLSARGTPLEIGDVLEETSSNDLSGSLYIAKYTGFDKAVWFVPEPKTENQSISTPEASA